MGLNLRHFPYMFTGRDHLSPPQGHVYHSLPHGGGPHKHPDDAMHPGRQKPAVEVWIVRGMRRTKVAGNLKWPYTLLHIHIPAWFWLFSLEQEPSPFRRRYLCDSLSSTDDALGRSPLQLNWKCNPPRHDDKRHFTTTRFFSYASVHSIQIEMCKLKVAKKPLSPLHSHMWVTV